MPTCDALRNGLFGVCLVAFGGCLTTSAGALDAQSAASAAPLALGSRSVGEAFRSGIRDYNQGDKAGALKALEYAASQGHAMARWKLGRMYADGDGVPVDRLRAFEHFSKICDAFADEYATFRQPTAWPFDRMIEHEDAMTPPREIKVEARV